MIAGVITFMVGAAIARTHAIQKIAAEQRVQRLLLIIAQTAHVVENRARA